MPPLTRTRIRIPRIPLASSSWAKTPEETGGADVGTRPRSVLRQVVPDTAMHAKGRPPGSMCNRLSGCSAALGTPSNFELSIAVRVLLPPSAAVAWLAADTRLVSADATTDEYDSAKRAAVFMQSASVLVPQ